MDQFKVAHLTARIWSRLLEEMEQSGDINDTDDLVSEEIAERLLDVYRDAIRDGFTCRGLMKFTLDKMRRKGVTQ